MKYLLGIFLVIASGVAEAATWYVRPAASGEYGLEDGTSYANAYDGAVDIVWGVGGVQAGDTLYVCGEFNDNTSLGPSVSGTSGSPIVIDGNCSASGDRPMAKINAGSAATALSNGNQTFITLRNIEATGGSGITQRIVNVSSAGSVSATAINVVMENIIAHDTMGEGQASRSLDYQCFRLDGSNITLRNVRAYNCEGDGIYTEGNDQLIEDAQIWNVDLSGTPFGDCIQYGGGLNSTEYAHNRDTVRRLYCNHSSKDTKHGMIFGCDTGAGTSVGLVLEDSTIIGAAYNAAVHSCDEVTLRRNSFKLATSSTNMRGLGTFSGTSGESITFQSNIVDMRGAASNAFGIFIDTSGGFTLSADNNVFIGDRSPVGRGIYVFSPTAGTALIRNNVFSGIETAGMQGGVGATYTSTNNAFFNNGTNCAGITCTSSVTSDPQFVGGSSPSTAARFKLKNSSPLIGTGSPLGAKYDYENRRCGNPSTIGAYCTPVAATRSSFSTRTTYVTR